MQTKGLPLIHVKELEKVNSSMHEELIDWLMVGDAIARVI
jgi:hypothetical protein